MSLLAWHFLPANRKTRWNSKLVEVGQTIKWAGPLKLCESGLHASVKALDALQYAPGPIICRVELSGEIIKSTDKCVASKRKCLAINDATETLRYFARLCALSVLDKWAAPQIVQDYLATGDEKIRAAAEAWSAARSWSAAWSAAEAAAWSAAEAAARDAARSAAAARDAARAAAWSAVEAAARAAARAAAWSAVEAAARAAAWSAVEAAQEKELSKLLTECLEVA